VQHQVPPQAAILQVIAGYWLSCPDYPAARLKLADQVNGKTSLSAFAQLTDTRPKSLRRLMRTIAEAGLGHDHYNSWRAVETCLFQSGTAFERVGRELLR
jgi:hypothetical protein